VTSSPPSIHPNATVHPQARLEADVVAGPGVVIEADVEVGAGTHLLPGAVLMSGTRVGRRCRVGPYAIIGAAPMDTHFRGEPSLAVLDDDVTVREFATVHRATGEGEVTRVGNGSFVMSAAHVSHNTVLGRGCVLTTNVQLGGHAHVGEYAVLGAMAILHQHCRVGAYAMFGAGSAANLDVLPYAMARGNPARHYRVNRVGLQRHGIDGERYRAIEGALRALRRRDRETLEALARDSEDALALLEFVDGSKRGVLRFVTKG